jgi:hypothetical protein
LLKGLDLLNIHDDIHPAIMDEASPVVEAHFMLESRHHVQTHFILEKTISSEDYLFLLIQ